MKKYDCTKTEDFIHEIQRMCDAGGDNCDCPCGYPQSGCINLCPVNNIVDSAYVTAKVIPIIQKWSDEHPEKTRKDVYLEMLRENGFDSKELARYCGKVHSYLPCPSSEEGHSSSCAECQKYWNEVVN